MVLIPLIKAITRKSDNQDAGYWMLDTGLTRYSVDFIKRRAKQVLFPATSNKYRASSIQKLVAYLPSIFIQNNMVQL
jgi:hypothetical protein